MKLADQLNELSAAIRGFDQPIETFALESVDPSSLNRLRVYRKNLYYGIHKRLAEDLSGLAEHLGEDNFHFFARKFALDTKLTSPNILDVTIAFQSFVDEHAALHQDLYLAPLIKLDLLLERGQTGDRVTVPQGMFAYWAALRSGNAATAADFEHEETIVRSPTDDGDVLVKENFPEKTPPSKFRSI